MVRAKPHARHATRISIITRFFSFFLRNTMPDRLQHPLYTLYEPKY